MSPQSTLSGNAISHPGVSFFTKGDKLEHDGSFIFVNQCYVQYMRPIPSPSSDTKFESLLPILFIHGGGLTGAQWESTPDRRPGWAVGASDAGHPVYILDSVDSGRSQVAPASIRRGPVEHRNAEAVWSRFRFGSPEGFKDRKLFDGSQVCNESLDALIASQAARRRTTDEVEMNGIIAAIREIDKCIIVAHSHGAALVMDALELVHGHIHRLVLVEPGETGVASRLLAQIPTLLIWGDYISNHAAWIKINEPYRKAPVDTLVLPEVGITGNSHFPMLDRNSDEIFEKILDWLRTT
jgi:hypothetical protein